MSAILGGKKETGTTQTTGSEAFTSRQASEFRPEDIQAINQARQSSLGAGQNLTGLIQNLQAQISAEGPFKFGSPDAITRALASQAGQQVAQQTAAQRAAIAQQFRGQPGAQMALQRQADIQSRLQQNPLLFNAYQNQQQRQLQELGAKQAIRGEQLGLGQTGYGISQQDLRNAQAIADMFKSVVSSGTKTAGQTTETSGRSGGILQNFGAK